MENAFVQYLVDIADTLYIPLRAVDLLKEHEALGFCSSIKMGYGLGSSGALSAAIYWRYGTKKASSAELDNVRADLARIESFFHGSSSGFDPLVSYFHKAFIRAEGYCKKIDFSWPTHWNIYLIDSGSKRNTAQCVAQYRNLQATGKMLNNDMRMLSLQNDCIKSLLVQAYAACWNSAKTLSRLQYSCMQSFILPAVKPLWKAQLDNPDSFLKLCGAGMGGYYLWITRNDYKPETVLPLRKINL